MTEPKDGRYKFVAILPILVLVTIVVWTPVVGPITAGPPMTVLRVAITVVAGLTLFAGGWLLLDNLMHPVPPPSESDETTEAPILYCCKICGMVIKLAAAPNEDLEPPRHCQKNMSLMAPIE